MTHERFQTHTSVPVRHARYTPYAWSCREVFVERLACLPFLVPGFEALEVAVARNLAGDAIEILRSVDEGLEEHRDQAVAVLAQVVGERQLLCPRPESELGGRVTPTVARATAVGWALTFMHSALPR